MNRSQVDILTEIKEISVVLLVVLVLLDMEVSILTEEIAQVGASSPSKSIKSRIEIDSISIDLVSAKEQTEGKEQNEAATCEHFSIRGYVAGVREKDGVVCWPFGLDSDSNKLEEQMHMLPPLHAPKFRHWRCQNCLQETGIKDNASLSKHNNKSKCNNTSSQMPSSGDDEMILAEFQLSLKVGISSGGTNGDVITATTLKENEVENPKTSVLGDENDWKDSMNRDVPDSVIASAREVNLCLNGETQSDKTGTLKSGGDRLLESNKQNQESIKVVEVAIRDCGISKLSEDVHEVCTNVNGHKSALPTQGFIDGRCVSISSSSFDDVLIGRNLYGRQFTRRRHQKYRFLSDILGINEISNTKELKMENSIPDASIGCKMSEAGGKRGRKRKMKVSEDEDWGPKCVIQKVGVTTGNSSSESGEKSASTEICSKSHSSKHKVKRKSILGKMKSKKMKVDRKVMTSRECQPKESQKNSKEIGRKRTLLKVKNKMRLHGEMLTAERLTSEENVSSHLGVQMDDGKYVSQFENGKGCTLPQQEGVLMEDQIMRKSVEIHSVEGNATVCPSVKTVPNAFSGKGIQFDLNSNIVMDMPSFPFKKRNRTPRFEDGGCSTVQQSGLSNTYNTEKPIQIQEESADTKKQSDKNAEKVFETGTMDDIPMEIVELLAKHQFERRRRDAEFNRHFSEKTNSTSIGNPERMDLTRICQNGVLSFPQEAKPSMLKPKSGILSSGKNVAPTKGKSVGYHPFINGNNFNISQTEESSAFKGFGPFMHSREKIANVAHYFDNSCSSHMSAQKFKPDKELNHVRSPMMLYPKPCRLDSPQKSLLQSNMDSQYTSRPNEQKLNGSHGLKSIDLNSSLEEQGMGGEHPFSVADLRSEIHPRMLGTLDRYSNETIPAMHLLSLMESKTQSITSFRVNENPSSFDNSSFLHDHHPHSSGLKIDEFKYSEKPSHQIPSFYAKKYLPDHTHRYNSAVPTDFRKLSDFKCQHSSKFNDKGKGKVIDPDKLYGGNTVSHTVDNSARLTKLEFHGKYSTSRDPKMSFKNEVCSLNRNPAEFSIPEAGNIYTIGADDLKLCENGHNGKRQRSGKLITIKKHTRNHLP